MLSVIMLNVVLPNVAVPHHPPWTIKYVIYFGLSCSALKQRHWGHDIIANVKSPIRKTYVIFIWPFDRKLTTNINLIS
jgi:hypothetical protein